VKGIQNWIRASMGRDKERTWCRLSIFQVWLNRLWNGDQLFW